MREIIICRRVNSDDPGFQKLVRELDNHLAMINGSENDFFAQFNKIDSINHVVVACKGVVPVGCGAMKEYVQDTMEIKRMFVPEEMRGQGIASLVLCELEVWAKELNYAKTLLETSTHLTPAIGLYKKSGYRVIPNYGQYEDVTTSVCFEKLLNL